MARKRGTTNDGHDPIQVERTRTSAAWAAVIAALIFLILLIVFIAQNNRSVPLHFLGADGNVSEALALIVAALAGAVLVVLIGTGRILQLRLAARRHNKQAKRTETAPADDASATSSSTAPR